MKCKKCNNQINEELKFCGKCESSVNSSIVPKKIMIGIMFIMSFIYLTAVIFTDRYLFVNMNIGSIIARLAGILVGIVTFPGLIAAIYYKFFGKRKNQEEKFETAAVIYCTITGFFIIGHFFI